jgi:hypothetical protein
MPEPCDVRGIPDLVELDAPSDDRPSIASVSNPGEARLTSLDGPPAR